MIVPLMAISNFVLTQQIYSEETNGAHAHNRDRVALKCVRMSRIRSFLKSLAFVNGCIQKVNLFMRYFSRKFN